MSHSPADGTVRIADKGHELSIDTKLMGGVVTYPKQLWHFVGELEPVTELTLPLCNRPHSHVQADDGLCLQARFGKHLESLNFDLFKKVRACQVELQLIERVTNVLQSLMERRQHLEITAELDDAQQALADMDAMDDEDDDV